MESQAIKARFGYTVQEDPLKGFNIFESDIRNSGALENLKSLKVLRVYADVVTGPGPLFSPAGHSSAN